MYHTLSQSEILKEFNSSQKEGLGQIEALKRLKRNGPNLLPEKREPPTIFKFIEQFQNVLVIILLIAVAISLAVGEVIDALAILAIVLLNATIGFIQEVQAEKTLDSLKEKDILITLVLRDGQIARIPFPDLVVGDIVILEEGSRVPADCRILESFSLKVDESILTGESVASDKDECTLSNPSLTLGDRANMVFRDTQVIAGRAKAMVVATGEHTEIGKIANFLQKEQEMQTPLTRELDQVGKMLTILIVVIAVGVFILSLLRREPLVESLLISISLAVAAIPEGLPAIVTIVLSLGVKRLAEKRTLVKKLPAVETLGAIHVIATDKTGTITQNKMNVVSITLPNNKKITVSGNGFEPVGEFLDSKKRLIDPSADTKLITLLSCGILANNSQVDTNTTPVEVIGDTTEAALLIAASRAGMILEEFEKNYERLHEIPFSSERKMMSVVVKEKETNEYILISKGAPETLIEHCLVSEKEKGTVRSMLTENSKKGYRTLAIGRRTLTKKELQNLLDSDVIPENNLEYLGLLSMQDPLRPEVVETIQKAGAAGIRTIMITGDHKETAATIAKLAGIMKDNTTVLTDREISLYTISEIAERIEHGVSVFARISPMNKLKIVQAIKSITHTQVAVTGDGVNDAPALKAAHIGIAMGQSGTDLTREVADIIIIDDNYVTIIDAIGEGRVIFANLVKFIRYLISCNISEVFIVAVGAALSTPTPLFSVQLLWINFITDGFPALALGIEPPEIDVMKYPPRNLREGILHKRRWVYMIIEGLIMGTTVFSLFLFSLQVYGEQVARTMAFSAVALVQIVHAFNNRSTKKSLFEMDLFSNKALIAAAVFSLTLQVLVVQTDIGNSVFKTIPLTLPEWNLVLLTGLITFTFVEIKKFFRVKIFPKFSWTVKFAS